MTTPNGCQRQKDGDVELYFYGEIEGPERERMRMHLRECRECALALEELTLIRSALAERPDIAAPPAGDWSGFMRRLDEAVGAQRSRLSGEMVVSATAAGRARKVPSYTGLLATAALLAIVTMNVLFVAKGRSTHVAQPATIAGGNAGDATPVATGGLKSVGEQHFERSKLVVLGLTAKEPAQTTVSDWAYERELATSLLNDTRLYRLAAEEKGLTSLAGVMRDLELVLLETSMADSDDKDALDQIQRLIRKRGLIQKMDTVASVGM
jgi:hypothetical protein